MIVCEDKGTALGAIYELNNRIAGKPYIDSYADTGAADGLSGLPSDSECV